MSAQAQEDSEYPGGATQRATDEAHLQTLAILYYVVAGVQALGVLVLVAQAVIFYVVFTGISSEPQADADLGPEHRQLLARAAEDLEAFRRALEEGTAELPPGVTVEQARDWLARMDEAGRPLPTAPAPTAPAGRSRLPAAKAEMRLFLNLALVFCGVLAVVLGVTAWLFVLAGHGLRQRRRYLLIFVLACVACLNVPLGTALGIFTIMVLNRPSVRLLFGRA